MKKLFSLFAIPQQKSQLFDLVLDLLSKEDFGSMRKVGENVFATEKANISIKYFDNDSAFEEIQISFGYELGKGVTVVLRNYIEHLIVLNHQILDAYYSIETKVSPGFASLRDYRRAMDDVADRICAFAESNRSVEP